MIVIAGEAQARAKGLNPIWRASCLRRKWSCWKAQRVIQTVEAVRSELGGPASVGVQGRLPGGGNGRSTGFKVWYGLHHCSLCRKTLGESLSFL